VRGSDEDRIGTGGDVYRRAYPGLGAEEGAEGAERAEVEAKSDKFTDKKEDEEDEEESDSDDDIHSDPLSFPRIVTPLNGATFRRPFSCVGTTGREEGEA